MGYMIIKLYKKKQLSKKQLSKKQMVSCLMIGIILVVTIGLIVKSLTTKEILKTGVVDIEGQGYTLTLKNHQLYVENSTTKVISTLLEEPLLDMTCYDMNQDGKKELLVLTLNKESSKVKGRSFGRELQFYTLEVENELLTPYLIYKNDISSVNPFSLRAGKLEPGEAYTNIFVGVYKNTKYYKEVMNRPFFFSWNGEFIERKWTGSYLSHNELMDLVFVDLTGDGADEVAVLEKTPAGTYQVSLYKWLNFGFDYLTTSKQTYPQLGCLKLEKKGEQSKIKLQYSNGAEEEVDF